MISTTAIDNKVEFSDPNPTPTPDLPDDDTGAHLAAYELLTGRKHPSVHDYDADLQANITAESADTSEADDEHRAIAYLLTGQQQNLAKADISEADIEARNALLGR
ncbi:hypothetical protein [Tsukamurella strandjordii]|uniref:Uncharacterized protein n=1 Tax=Tsukamurella strandjordii TaxID=147577 RepID=A0AA90NBJ9_9ACTN|nr:hypothetical protein [Tsukamurella strandjordii]MDP0398703.1 hypothetical protein [Tsukamurella strandjordii]